MALNLNVDVRRPTEEYTPAATDISRQGMGLLDIIPAGMTGLKTDAFKKGEATSEDYWEFFSKLHPQMKTYILRAYTLLKDGVPPDQIEGTILLEQGKPVDQKARKEKGDAITAATKLALRRIGEGREPSEIVVEARDQFDEHLMQMSLKLKDSPRSNASKTAAARNYGQVEPVLDPKGNPTGKYKLSGKGLTDRFFDAVSATGKGSTRLTASNASANDGIMGSLSSATKLVTDLFVGPVLNFFGAGSSIVGREIVQPALASVEEAVRSGERGKDYTPAFYKSDENPAQPHETSLFAINPEALGEYSGPIGNTLLGFADPVITNAFKKGAALLARKTPGVSTDIANMPSGVTTSPARAGWNRGKAFAGKIAKTASPANPALPENEIWAVAGSENLQKVTQHGNARLGAFSTDRTVAKITGDATSIEGRMGSSAKAVDEVGNELAMKTFTKETPSVDEFGNPSVTKSTEIVHPLKEAIRYTLEHPEETPAYRAYNDQIADIADDFNISIKDLEPAFMAAFEVGDMTKLNSVLTNYHTKATHAQVMANNRDVITGDVVKDFSKQALREETLYGTARALEERIKTLGIKLTETQDELLGRYARQERSLNSRGDAAFSGAVGKETDAIAEFMSAKSADNIKAGELRTAVLETQQELDKQITPSLSEAMRQKAYTDIQQGMEALNSQGDLFAKMEEIYRQGHDNLDGPLTPKDKNNIRKMAKAVRNFAETRISLANAEKLLEDAKVITAKLEAIASNGAESLTPIKDKAFKISELKRQLGNTLEQLAITEDAIKSHPNFARYQKWDEAMKKGDIDLADDAVVSQVDARIAKGLEADRIKYGETFKSFIGRSGDDVDAIEDAMRELGVTLGSAGNLDIDKALSVYSRLRAASSRFEKRGPQDPLDKFTEMFHKKIQDKILAAKEAQLNRRVADGELTPEQAATELAIWTNDFTKNTAARKEVTSFRANLEARTHTNTALTEKGGKTGTEIGNIDNVLTQFTEDLLKQVEGNANLQALVELFRKHPTTAKVPFAKPPSLSAMPDAQWRDYMYSLFPRLAKGRAATAWGDLDKTMTSTTPTHKVGSAQSSDVANKAVKAAGTAFKKAAYVTARTVQGLAQGELNAYGMIWALMSRKGSVTDAGLRSEPFGFSFTRALGTPATPQAAAESIGGLTREHRMNYAQTMGPAPWRHGVDVAGTKAKTLWHGVGAAGTKAKDTFNTLRGLTPEQRMDYVQTAVPAVWRHGVDVAGTKAKDIFNKLRGQPPKAMKIKLDGLGPDINLEPWKKFADQPFTVLPSTWQVVMGMLKNVTNGRFTDNPNTEGMDIDSDEMEQLLGKGFEDWVKALPADLRSNGNTFEIYLRNITSLWDRSYAQFKDQARGMGVNLDDMLTGTINGIKSGTIGTDDAATPAAVNPDDVLPDGFDEITDSIMQSEGGATSSPDVDVPNPYGVMPKNVFEGENSWGAKFMDAGTFASLKSMYVNVKGNTATPDQRKEFEQQYAAALTPDVLKKITRQVLKDNPAVMKEIDNLLSDKGGTSKALAKSLSHAAYNMPAATKAAIAKIKKQSQKDLPAFAASLYSQDKKESETAEDIFRDAMWDVALANVTALAKSKVAKGEDLSADEYNSRVTATWERFLKAAGLEP